MYRILEKRELNEQVTKMVIDAPAIAKKAEPGQFVILCERGWRADSADHCRL